MVTGSYHIADTCDQVQTNSHCNLKNKARFQFLMNLVKTGIGFQIQWVVILVQKISAEKSHVQIRGDFQMQKNLYVQK